MRTWKANSSRSDPFITEGYYASFDLFELMESDKANNWLMDGDQTQTNLKH